jgi:hypothetical protein
MTSSVQLPPSIAVAVVVSLLGTLLPVAGFAAAAVWVYADARDRGHDAAGWLATGTVLVPFVLPGYLLWVGLGRFGERSSPPSRRERAAGTVGFGAVSAFLVAGVVAPPDPVTGTVYAVVAFVPAAVVAGVLTGRVGPSGRQP